MTKISIILPVYNVEKYLSRCIDSVLNQTLTDIEIILATDGPEACDEICEEYAQKDSRIKILYHPGSYGKAFNKSLEIAEGEYIGIVEADDWCDAEMYEKMYNMAVKNNADVVKTGFNFAFDDKSKNYHTIYIEYPSDLKIEQNQRFLSSQPSVWSCIYKKDFLLENNIKMIEKRMSFIDAPFHYETLYKAEKYVLLKEPLYYYYQDNEFQTIKNVKPLDGLNAEIYAYEKLKSDKVLKKLESGFIYATIVHLLWNYERLTQCDKAIFWNEAHKYVNNLSLTDDSLKFLNQLERKFLFDLRKYNYNTLCLRDCIKKVLSIIFSVRNQNNISYKSKVITIFGIKIKVTPRKNLRNSLNYYFNEWNYYKNEFEKLNSAVYFQIIENQKKAQRISELSMMLKKNEKEVENLNNIDNMPIVHNMSELLGYSETSKNEILRKHLTEIEIEIFNFCNRKCWFCPNNFIDRHSNVTFLEENAYLNILQQLKDINFSRVITYARYNEPLSQKDVFLNRLRQAREYCPNAILRTNTNGDYIDSVEYIDQLASAGLNELEIQCYLGKDEEYSVAEFMQRSNNWSKKLNLSYEIVNHEFWIEAIFNYERMKLTFAMRNFKNDGCNRGDLLNDIKTFDRQSPCLIPFQHLYIDYSGDVMLCCNLRHDAPQHKDFIIGNIYKESLADIFMSENIIKYRKLLSYHGSKISPCNSCSYFVHQKYMNLAAW